MPLISTSLSLDNSTNIYVSSGSTVISTMYFCNWGSSAANLNVWVTGSGAAYSATANLVYREISIAAGDTFVVDREKLVLGSGDYIRANAGSSVSATVSWVGI